MSEFSAGPHALGYFFQARRGLFVLLRGADDGELIVERLDDLELSTAEGVHTLEQLKHHISRAASLSDTSADLWKTLRVWATQVADGSFDPNGVTLSLVTTARADDAAIAALLRDGPARDEEAALRRLNEIARTSTNNALAPAFRAFTELTASDQRALLASIRVFDSSPDISATAEEIKSTIRYATSPERLQDLYESFEGWWFGKVADQLMSGSHRPIARFEVHDKIRRIAAQYLPDSLPIDFLDAIPPAVDLDADTRIFVQQLKAVTQQQLRIERAVTDYYRAYEQRSRWLRKDLLVDADLEEYERRLIDEWERFRLALEDSERLNRDDSAACNRFGTRLLNWMETEAEVPIRPRVTEGYVMRGSYHMLANRDQPAVWWHPHFLD